MTLSARDLAAFNPNTHTCPVFRTRQDAEIAAKLYRAAPILKNEVTGESPWQVEFRAMFHMSNDSHLFFTEPGPDRVPLYEAKLFHQFDHRWATYEEDGGTVRELSDDEKADPTRTIRPRYWVARKEVEARIPEWWREGWLLAFRNITNATNERTLMATVMPMAAVGHTAPVIFLHGTSNYWSLFLGNFNSLILDFVARMKVGGTHIDYFILLQLPMLSIDQYGKSLAEIISDLVLKLVVISNDIEETISAMHAPYVYLDRQRSYLRARLDALYAHLYGLSREELMYILDPKMVMGQDFPSETFRVLKERELRQFGEYRTARLVLEAYDQLAVERFGVRRARPTA